uniref:Uncharacterized protein n=1 Tax=Panagrolaimus sp. PS1159 TaxID=55785 RepID=A0AC35F7Q5_9BILA
MSSWEQTFPQHPDDNPSAFFLSSFDREVEGDGKELLSAILQLKHVFGSKTVSNVIFMICETSADDPLESMIFDLTFKPVLKLSQVTKEKAHAKIKEDTFKELDHIYAIAQCLPPLSAPLLNFQLRYKLNASGTCFYSFSFFIGKENAPLNESFVLIQVNPLVHLLYGFGADDLAVAMKLSRCERFHIWLHSKLIKSISEIDSQIAEYERSGLIDETIFDLIKSIDD